MSNNTPGNYIALQKGVAITEYIIRTKNKKEEKVVKAFLSSLDIYFYTEAQEEEALYNKMTTDRKTPLLSETQRDSFIKQLKSLK